MSKASRVIKKKAILVDLDGTLADIEHRVYHVTKSPPDWKSFYQGIDQDRLWPWCFELIQAMRASGYEVLFVTGREEYTRANSQEWLDRHHLNDIKLLMRGKGDTREDAMVKKDIFLQGIDPLYEVLFVVDDRRSVVEMWREMGLVCLQCAPGEF